MDLITLILSCSLYSDNSIVNAMIQTGSQNNPLMVTVQNSNPTTFPTMEKASAYIDAQLQQSKSVDVGVMQIPSRWFAQYHVTPADILRPCKNVNIATKILMDAENTCSQNNAKDLKVCALSTYKTGDATQGAAFADSIIKYSEANPFVPPPPKIPKSAPAPGPVKQAPKPVSEPTEPAPVQAPDLIVQDKSSSTSSSAITVPAPADAPISTPESQSTQSNW